MYVGVSRLVLLLSVYAWVKVFRIILEFRIMLNLADYYSFSGLFSVHLRTIDHLT